MTKKKQNASKLFTPMESTILKYLSSTDDYIGCSDVIGVPLELLPEKVNMSRLSALGVVGSLVRKGIVITFKTDDDIVLLALRDERDADFYNELLSEQKEKALTAAEEALVKEFIEVNEEILRVLDGIDGDKPHPGLCPAQGADKKNAIETTEYLIEEARTKVPSPTDLAVSYQVLEDLKQKPYHICYAPCCDSSEGSSSSEIINKLSPEELKQAKELAKKLLNQDTRGTALPIRYALQDKVSRYDPDGDFIVYYDSSTGGTYLGETIDEIFEQLVKDNDLSEEDELNRCQVILTDVSLTPEEMKEELAEAKRVFEAARDEILKNVEEDLQRVSYEFETKEIFLTEEAAREHLQANKHHYTDDVRIYVEHAWRNPEAALVHKILTAFA